ncbi:MULTISPECIES: hypothetical protein [Mycobacterium]|uniref:Uncharacterized protein n=1 Tax=Mycobacterium persicum TaxID=1487726 RepID=A0AB38UQP9_9MYCO|nr:hypothetical protein LAUMK15_01701 [Mycobacterium persicum]VAZ82756.1 hypothetical protein LAUMK42_01566 [Mycobacterium persicum]VAZ90253.1 hypothetical protein LAUMK4_01337 [Mycobacterium persicum]
MSNHKSAIPPDTVPTLLAGWTGHDLAAHIVSRERGLAAGVCIVLVSRQFS